MTVCSVRLLRRSSVTTQPTQTSLRRLQDVLKRSQHLATKQDVVASSGKRCWTYDVLKASYLRHLEDVWFSTSWRRLIYVVLITSNLQLLESVWFATSSKCLIYDVLKTSDLRCLEDVRFTLSWRRPIYDVFKTSNLWRLQDVCKRHLCSNVAVTSIQRRKKWLFLIFYCLKYSESFKCSSLS